MIFKLMYRIPVRAVLVITVLSLGLAACAGNNNIVKDIRIMTRSSEGLTPAQAQQLERLKRYANMRVQATAGGALLGGLTCGLLSGKNKVRNAAACALAGGFAGYYIGAYYANINSVAENKRKDLDTRLAASQAAVKETQEAAAVTYRANKETRDRIKRINAQYSARSITLAQYKKEAEATQVQVDNSAATLELAEGDLKNIEQAIKDAKKERQDTKDLKKQRDAMEREVEALRKAHDQMVAAQSTIPADIRNS